MGRKKNRKATSSVLEATTSKGQGKRHKGEEHGKADPGQSSERGDQTTIYSRKAKSLGLLCRNFIGYYSLPTSPAIIIDSSARMLGVERRRVYDIINILEAVDMVARSCKNTYVWRGDGGMSYVFNRVMWEGVVDGVRGVGKWKGSTGFKRILTDREADAIRRGDYDYNKPWSFKKSSPPSASPSNSKDKSLARLSLKFCQMFLACVGEHESGITLTDASAWILGPESEDRTGVLSPSLSNQPGVKTKVRRLYDIANVMVSLGVIKNQGKINGRPTFVWCWKGKDITHVRAKGVPKTGLI